MITMRIMRRVRPPHPSRNFFPVLLFLGGG
jgi:hypothetical protein